MFPPEEEGSLTHFTPLGWENLSRVITTYLFGTFTKWSLDGIATRNTEHFLSLLQGKVDCILQNNGNFDSGLCRDILRFELNLLHDTNFISLMKQYGL